MTDNKKLAKAVVALYGVTTAPDAEWTDEDEAIQQAAFKLYEAADCHAETFAQYMLEAGCSDIDLVASFTDVPERTVRRIDAFLKGAAQ